MNKNLYLLLCLFLLSGCSGLLVKNPTINDISGVWEASGPMPYAKLIIKPNKENLLIVVQDTKKVERYKIESFKSNENGFEFELVDLEKKKDPEKMNGAIIFNRVVLSPVKDEKIKIWFVRSNELIKYQEIAFKEINKHNNAVKYARKKHGLDAAHEDAQHPLP